MINRKTELIKAEIEKYYFKDIDESIEDVRNSTIVTFAVDVQNKPYTYSDAPLVDDCVNALKIIKNIKLILENTTTKYRESEDK